MVSKETETAREVVALTEQSAEFTFDQTSMHVARDVANPFIGMLSDTENPYSKCAMDRLARMSAEARQGFVSSLLVDPSRSGIVFPRYQLDGRAPLDVDGEEPDKVVALWSALAKDIPKLVVPEELRASVMASSERLGMMGRTEHMLATEEAERIRLGENTMLHIRGAANKANRVRLVTANEVLKSQDPDTAKNALLIATTDATRQLKPAEKAIVKDFAPDAENEFELFIASAIAEGYAPHPKNMTGPKILPDGTISISLLHGTLGTELVLVSPKKYETSTGKHATGLFNAYAALQAYGSRIVRPDFSLNGLDIVEVTSSHYMPVAVLNNLDATAKLELNLGSIRAIGDVQPKRSADAYLVEFGLFMNRIESLDPQLRAALLAEM